MTRIALGAVAVVLGLPTGALGSTPYDVSGDGRQDAVLGVPGWSAGGAPNAGAVIVLQSGSGSLLRRSRLLMEGVDGVPGMPQGDDAFGAWTASGDFDGDGFADLAVAAPGDRTTLVLLGSRTGLVATGIRTVPAAGPLVAGDLDRDGDADLVVGTPDADALRNADYGSGAVRLFSGGRHGLSMAPTRTLRRPRRQDDEFGAALALADVDRDGRLDIVEGAQGSPENEDGEGAPGHLSYCPGSRSGPKRCRAVGAPIPGGPTTLLVADVDGDGFGDVVGGRPVDRFIIEDPPSGAVHVWRGTASGPRTASLAISQRSPGVPGRAQRGDAFGASLAAADIDRDGFRDLIVGAPGKDNGRGRVTYIRGASQGYARIGNNTLQQGRAGIHGPRRRDDRFGAAVTVLPRGARRPPDVLIGAPGDRSITLLRARGPQRFRAVSHITPALLGLRVPPEPPDVLGGFGTHLGRAGSS